MIRYELRLTHTASGAGYFSCVPADPIDIDTALTYLRAHPFDEFMHKYLLGYTGYWNGERMEKSILETDPGDRVMRSILYEACCLTDKFRHLRDRFDTGEIRQLAACSPLIYIKSALMTDQERHAKWNAVFGANILSHQILPPPGSDELPEIPPGYDDLPPPPATVHIRDLYPKFRATPLENRSAPCTAEETYRTAMAALSRAGIALGPEMRHESSLSPIALLRQWQLSIRVQNHRHDFTLKGVQTAYGRGLTLAGARASCIMEIIERYGAFAGVDREGVVGYIRRYPLTHASYDGLAGSDAAALDPNTLCLEVPYRNEPLYWLQAEQFSGRDHRPIWIPAQCVFLFCNLDEPCLFSGLGSTGLASGNTLAEAKYHALLELIERDAEGTTPYDPARCFHITSDDPQIAALLADYQDRGIHIQFQDIGPRFGVPCYKCFVIGPDGGISKGAAAHLTGQTAVVSAMTETPYPYPNGPVSGPGLSNLPTVKIEDLPDYATGSSAGDLSLLETLLAANGYHPVYADLTRKDLGIPVVRALVPGMLLMADFDDFSRVHPRLFQNYLELFGQKTFTG